MMHWEEKIQELLRLCDVGDAHISPVPKDKPGDFSIACFDLAKLAGCSPVECANKLVEKINSKDIHKFGLEKVVQEGPYVNFFVDSGSLAVSVIGQTREDRCCFGGNKIGAGKKIIIEYPSNNTHKELHIGHLRNICIGNSLYNILSACGFDVLRVNYINDFGAHVAKCLWGVKKFHEGEVPPKGEEQKWLGEIYAEASAYLKDNAGAQPEVAELQQKLESKSQEIWPLFEKTRKWSLDGFDKAFDELKVKHDAVFFEQDTKSVGQKIVDDLISKKIAQVGEGGAIIIDLSKFGLDVGLLRKSNGAGLYLTSDLGLAVAKNKKFQNISESIHVTGSEQAFYFKQLFKILEIAGYNYKMTHIPYGLVTRKEGKMSSRSGNVILYEDIKNDVLKKTVQEIKNRHANWPERKINDSAFRIAMCAIKFEFLKHESTKNIIFDADAALNFDGFTGPYVLYTIARINSILKKSKKMLWFGVNLRGLKEQEEKELLLLISQYPQIILKAFKNYNPSVVAKYCFELSQKFNDFYAKHSVLSASSSGLVKARLVLCDNVRVVLSGALSLLSIDTVDEM